MARVTVEDCLEQVDSRFSLVHLAVRRVLQMRSGALLLIDAPKNKEVVLALREIAAGKVTKDNIRQLEEQRALPEKSAQLKDDANVREEIKEILDTASQLGAPADEYGAEEEMQESDED